jgi:hypothetical protein
MYHPECVDQIEILIVDNHPDGPCGPPLRELNGLTCPIRYVPIRYTQGTAIRDVVMREARGDFVLCLDCHVLLASGSLRKLLDYLADHPDTMDLLQGPLLDNQLKPYASHFMDEWGAAMWGRWELDKRAIDPAHPPFEIPMQGLGLFCCRRAAWPGLNPRLRGFGGEEGYLHEKFRQAGGRVLCLPFLGWIHRFSRPMGVRYPLRLSDRLRNYLMVFREVGLPWAPVLAHFREEWSAEEVDLVVAHVERELASPYHRFESITGLQGPEREGLEAGAEAAALTVNWVQVPPSRIHADITRAAVLREVCVEACLRHLQSLLVVEVVDDVVASDWERLGEGLGHSPVVATDGPFRLVLELGRLELQRIVDEVPATRVDIACWLKRRTGTLDSAGSPLNGYLMESFQV